MICNICATGLDNPVYESETSPVLQIPMWIIYLCLPLGAIYFGIEIVLSVFARWDNPTNQRPDTQTESAS